MSMHLALQHLFPDAKLGDWELQDDGAGPYIKEWNRAEPQPPAGQINAVTQSQRDRANKNARFKREFQDSQRDEALITWIAGKHSLTYQEALAEIKVIREAL